MFENYALLKLFSKKKNYNSQYYHTEWRKLKLKITYQYSRIYYVKFIFLSSFFEVFTGHLGPLPQQTLSPPTVSVRSQFFPVLYSKFFQVLDYSILPSLSFSFCVRSLHVQFSSIYYFLRLRWYSLLRTGLEFLGSSN